MACFYHGSFYTWSVTPHPSHSLIPPPIHLLVKPTDFSPLFHGFSGFQSSLLTFILIKVSGHAPSIAICPPPLPSVDFLGTCSLCRDGGQAPWGCCFLREEPCRSSRLQRKQELVYGPIMSGVPVIHPSGDVLRINM